MKNRTTTSLRRHEDARTVLLRMAHDQERAARIGTLKSERPDLTWKEIAETVGVTERSAIDWQKTGGISHANCKRLAGVFGVDPDWLWSGAQKGTADLMGALAGNDHAQLDRIEAKLDLLLRMVGGSVDPADFTEDIVRSFEALLGPVAESDEPVRGTAAGTGAQR